jgi:hypothetical protein
MAGSRHMFFCEGRHPPESSLKGKHAGSDFDRVFLHERSNLLRIEHKDSRMASLLAMSKAYANEWRGSTSDRR